MKSNRILKQTVNKFRAMSILIKSRQIANLILSIILSVSFSNIAISQISELTGNESMVPSPNSSNLMSFVESQVSYSHGLPVIQMPIHTLESSKLSTNVGLSYHAGGIKVNQVASSVGLGWSLITGGSISRMVMGRSDFEATFGYQDVVFDPNNSQDLHFAEQGNWDLQPDIFYYSFGGYSGKFIMDKQGIIHELKKTELKIEYDESTMFWKITDPNGTRYYFENTEYSETETLCAGYEDISLQGITT